MDSKKYRFLFIYSHAIPPYVVDANNVTSTKNTQSFVFFSANILDDFRVFSVKCIIIELNLYNNLKN